MGRIVLLNNRGVTLIEMMISLVIILIVSLALMQTALVGINTNVQNSMRDEAVSVAEMRMNDLRSLPFTETLTHADLASGTTTATPVPRNLRGATIQYTPSQTISDINTSAKQITISVAWSYRGKSYNHSITSIMRRQ